MVRVRGFKGLRAGEVGLVVAALMIATAGLGLAADADGPAFTGCVSVADGTIYGVSKGSDPLVECAEGDEEIGLSPGDITSLSTGEGLLGGGMTGDVGVALAPSFQLPQQCPAAATAKWDPDKSTWQCASDLDTTYAAGEGLRLDEANTFHAESTAAGGVPQAHTLWVSPHWQYDWATRGGIQRRVHVASRVRVLNVAGFATPDDEATVDIYWYEDEEPDYLNYREIVPSGGRVEFTSPEFEEGDSVYTAGWVVVKSSHPVLVSGMISEWGHDEWANGMDFYPVDCSRPDGVEFVCTLFG